MTALEEERDHWVMNGYPAFDLAFLARCLAAIATPSRSLAGFKETPRPELEHGWLSAKRGVRHLTQLLENNVGIETSTLIPSTNALVPLVTYLGLRPETPMRGEDANALIYWLFGAFITGRYNQSGDTRIAEDAKAVRDDQPLRGLFQNLGLLGGRLEVTEAALAGKGAGSPYFILSYLVARDAGATDWFYAVRIGLDAKGGSAIEYHHVHPQATLRRSFSKSEINDLANLAFISGRANRRISSRSPKVYFPEIGDEELKRHFVPLAESVRTVDGYDEFVRQRRALLAKAITAFLDRYRPAFLSAESRVNPADIALSVTVYPPIEDMGRLIEFRGTRGSDVWASSGDFSEFQRFLSDIDDGLSASFVLGHDTLTADGGAEVLELPIGPFVVSGTVAEWQAMVERELAQPPDEGAVPNPISSDWTKERVPISVADTD
jgi:hypothetical protein